MLRLNDATFWHTQQLQTTAIDRMVGDAVRSLSRCAFSLGRGEDFAVIGAVDEPPPSGLTSWHPTAGEGTGLSLEVAVTARIPWGGVGVLFHSHQERERWVES